MFKEKDIPMFGLRRPYRIGRMGKFPLVNLFRLLIRRTSPFALPSPAFNG
jgi:hypothetical protein